MTNNFIDNVHTHCFTPKEPEVDVVEVAKHENILVCLTPRVGLHFISCKILEDAANHGDPTKLSLFISNSEAAAVKFATSLRRLTSCRVVESPLYRQISDYRNTVLTMGYEFALECAENGSLREIPVGLIIFDGCHGVMSTAIPQILTCIVSHDIRIIGLADSFFSFLNNLVEIETKLNLIEECMMCRAETASDVTSVLKYGTRPTEVLLEYATGENWDISDTIREMVNDILKFLSVHRYDPMETYGLDAVDLPDPIVGPKEILLQFLQQLDTLGPWAADKAALELTKKAEEGKIKTPYERHYLLLCAVSTILTKIRAVLNDFFALVDPVDRVFKFCSQKIKRVIEILQTFYVDEDSKREDSLCGLLFTNSPLSVKILYYILNDLKHADEKFAFLRILFCMEPSKEITSLKQIEKEHRKQEQVLKNFRLKECNLLISTQFLEEGIELPKCNLVINFDLPSDFRSYTLRKGRAKAFSPIFCLLVSKHERDFAIDTLAKYYETERMLLRKCNRLEPSKKDDDMYSDLILPFCPKRNCPYVDLSNAIALINKYCAKLPSDTFTRLAPMWKIVKFESKFCDVYICKIRLPINSPLKRNIVGCAMPSEVLARRFAALQCCLALHASGELDDNLMPITKEDFWAMEEEQLYMAIEEVVNGPGPRPGTTKRRQFYHKRIAQCLTNCRPAANQNCFLYYINMRLTCPIPEEQNIRGRKIHAPEDTPQGFAILTLKPIPKIGAFPIFTRSGEVEITLSLVTRNIVLNQSQIEQIVPFINYTFTNVLRLQKYLMMFDPASSENSYFVVPVRIENDITVDWPFIDLIYRKQNQSPRHIADEERQHFEFDAKNYEDAVVSPWYRNQDQPHYFYVGEICFHLTPCSSFPGEDYTTFEEYYKVKYGIQIQKLNQHLLDVDHTSARLNFLTPRYVNRKGVALPTKSDEKKKARRENLSQKQILVPELCDVHPFPASLWQKAVCLPCILHRLNALLLADELRCLVASDICLGSTNLAENFEWEPLDFGWNLANLARKKQHEVDGRKEEKHVGKLEQQARIKSIKPPAPSGPLQDDWLEVGTWSNDLADNIPDRSSDDSDDPGFEFNLPNNVTLLHKENTSLHWNEAIRYNSPTNFLKPSSEPDSEYWDSDSEFDVDDDDDDDDDYDDSDSVDSGGLKIEFTMKDEAEAVEDRKKLAILESLDSFDNDVEPWLWHVDKISPLYQDQLVAFNSRVATHRETIEKNVLCFSKTALYDFLNPLKGNDLTDRHSVCQTTNNDRYLEINNNFNFNLPNGAFMRQSVAKQIVGLDIKKLLIDKTKTEIKFSQIPDNFENIELTFDFDEQPSLKGHPGPSTSLILQALTMSNANDGINLERLETIGDSFLKYAITAYLYCKYENVHEGKLSHLRSKQVSNLNLYRLGKQKLLGESMIATKFEPQDNWLPPCYYVPRELERALIEIGLPANHWNRADLPSLHNLTQEEITALVRERTELLRDESFPDMFITKPNNAQCFIPYNLMTQHSIPDKSIADCVEALIGAYLVACGPRGALLFMSWLGIKVLPQETIFADTMQELMSQRTEGCTVPKLDNGKWKLTRFGSLQLPKLPLLRNVPDPEGELSRLLTGFEEFENSLLYRFKDRSYLLQAVSHASYTDNTLTDCYQRLEFLGDAVLDYLITRHLYEDARHHSPGALTDLRSALVNNTIFAALAVRHGFQKFFRHLCPPLHEVIDRFVRIQQETDYAIQEDCFLIREEETEEAEDVEVPKALGDIFESVAGAIFLDSGMSLNAVWRVYYKIMHKEIEAFSRNVPKSPIRELLEMEPETAQFGKPEKLADGRRVRVSVEIFGKGIFKGIGRNYRIAKCTAAKCALKQLKKKGCIKKK